MLRDVQLCLRGFWRDWSSGIDSDGKSVPVYSPPQAASPMILEPREPRSGYGALRLLWLRAGPMRRGLPAPGVPPKRGGAYGEGDATEKGTLLFS